MDALVLTPSETARFLSHVEHSDGHWLWTASKNRKGYGEFGLRRRVLRAHRVAYQAFVGPIPDGLEIDHLCNTRHCVNPAHMKVSTHYENVHRVKGTKTHCPHGHAYTVENTRVYRTFRICRTCDRLRLRVTP